MKGLEISWTVNDDGSGTYQITGSVEDLGLLESAVSAVSEKLKRSGVQSVTDKFVRRTYTNNIMVTFVWEGRFSDPSLARSCLSGLERILN